MIKSKTIWLSPGLWKISMEPNWKKKSSGIRQPGLVFWVHFFHFIALQNRTVWFFFCASIALCETQKSWVHHRDKTAVPPNFYPTGRPQPGSKSNFSETPQIEFFKNPTNGLQCKSIQMWGKNSGFDQFHLCDLLWRKIVKQEQNLRKAMI